MSTKLKIQKALAEVEVHEERGWLRGYEDGLAKREEQIVDLQSALEARNEKIRELTSRKKSPKTAREALELAWELAHPVKEGQALPNGTEYMYRIQQNIVVRVQYTPYTVVKWDETHLRTLDPLPEPEPEPEPEPDWLDAPAVLARLDEWDRDELDVFTPAHEREGGWVVTFSALTYHWSDLHDVTPLYPKGQDR